MAGCQLAAWHEESTLWAGKTLRQTEVERQLVVSECEGLCQLLAEREQVLLARLGELDTEIVRRREENAAHLCEETARLSTLITELEGKCQQPAPELLQGLRSAVSRGEEVMPLHLVPEFPELEKRLWDFPGENKLQEALMGFLGFRRAHIHAEMNLSLARQRTMVTYPGDLLGCS
ncbi:E3 ubiquitin-protein ligase TRIM11-like [Alligator sinensis]|uniref:E3 ubiquitin-protein ligase TRIM11-like n=1 Tax=Alligator sinensis TaxID=38654 RepID=A0A3Q0FND3_ALLSI|nr:E3 ubiquitin-protein ligase TRIM11-like [Alligator sinensis]